MAGAAVFTIAINSCFEMVNGTGKGCFPDPVTLDNMVRGPSLLRVELLAKLHLMIVCGAGWFYVD